MKVSCLSVSKLHCLFGNKLLCVFFFGRFGKFNVPVSWLIFVHTCTSFDKIHREREILHQTYIWRMLLSLSLLSSTGLLLARGNCLRFVIHCSFFGFPTCGFRKIFTNHMLAHVLHGGNGKCTHNHFVTLEGRTITKHILPHRL